MENDNLEDNISVADAATPRVSVIVPAYNTAGLLPVCIGSLCAQTYPAGALEIIIVDDGSTDDTYEVAQSLAREHGTHAIQVIHRENGGSSAARNTGLFASTGKYISFVDSDDYVDPRFIENMVNAISGYDVHMVQTGRDEISEDHERLPDVCVPPAAITRITGEEQLRLLLMHRGDASFCTKLTARELFFPKDAPARLFPEGMLNEDFLLLVQLLEDIPGLVLLPEQHYHVYYRTGSHRPRLFPAGVHGHSAQRRYRPGPGAG